MGKPFEGLQSLLASSEAKVGFLKAQTPPTGKRKRVRERSLTPTGFLTS